MVLPISQIHQAELGPHSAKMQTQMAFSEDLGWRPYRIKLSEKEISVFKFVEAWKATRRRGDLLLERI